MKLFLKRPEKAQGLVQKVLQAATAENDNPDVRDRAYVYWRLLSNTSDPAAAKNIVLSDKPPIVTTIHSLPPALLEQLLTELSTLSSVYHKPPEQFVGQGRFGADAVQKAAIEYVLVLPPDISTLLTGSQGTNPKRPRKPLGGGCGCGCRQWRRATPASPEQRGESLGYRFRRWRTGIGPERTRRRHVWPGRSRRNAHSSGVSCSRYTNRKQQLG